MARHLTMEERDRIAQLKHQGASQKEIAQALQRSPSTIPVGSGRPAAHGFRAHDLQLDLPQQGPRPLALLSAASWKTRGSLRKTRKNRRADQGSPGSHRNAFAVGRFRGRYRTRARPRRTRDTCRSQVTLHDHGQDPIEVRGPCTAEDQATIEATGYGSPIQCDV